MTDPAPFFPFPYTLAPDDGPPEPDPGPPPVVLLYGDSYTHMGSWPVVVRDRLRLSVGNDAQAGSGFVQYAGHSTFPFAVTQWRAPGAAVVVVFGGVNDLNGQQPPEAVGIAASVTLAAAQLANPGAVIVLAAPQWPATPPPATLAAVRDQCAAAAAGAGATYVDPSGWFAGRPDCIGPDNLHPNPAGQLLIADRMTPIVAAALDRYRQQQEAAA